MYKVLKTVEQWVFGDKFTVSQLLIETSDNQQVDFYMRSGNDFAVVIPILDDGRIVMVEQPRIGIEKQSLEFPMGSVAGETDGAAIAATELREETGYSAGTLDHVTSLYPSPGWSMQRAHFFIARDLQEGKAEPEPTEYITVKIMSVAEVEKAIKDGTIFSLATIAGFYYLRNYLSEKSRE